MVDSFGSAGEQLSRVLANPPSSSTYAVLEALGPLELTSRERVLLAQAWDRQLSAVTAHQLAALDAATWSGDTHLSTEVLEAEVALALRRSDRALDYELHNARGIAALACMSKLLRAGEITVRHALVVVDLTAPLTQ